MVNVQTEIASNNRTRETKSAMSQLRCVVVLARRNLPSWSDGKHYIVLAKVCKVVRSAWYAAWYDEISLQAKTQAGLCYTSQGHSMALQPDVPLEGTEDSLSYCGPRHLRTYLSCPT